VASREPPLYQAILRTLPGRHALAGTLGRLRGGRIKAVVIGAVVRLALCEGIQRAMFLDEYEPAQTQWFRECLSIGDVAVDVGASFGYYTTLAASLVGPAGKVYAFEPSPAASGVLEEAIAESGMGNVVLTKAAVGQAAGNVLLYLPSTPELHSPSLLHSDPAFTAVRVPLVSLDAFAALRDVSRIKLVKIDVEGYEPDVLEGMAGLIGAARVDNIICEFNSGWLRRNGTAPQKLLRRFGDLGFGIEKKTPLLENLRGRHGELFDLQDIWFTRS
jgi:FkbM family methyltransferase